jgi:hypothetical protein
MKRVTLIVAVVAVLATTPFAVDIFRDQQHRVIVRGSVQVYQTPEPYWRDSSNPVVATATKHDTLRVMRIRYGKDFMVIRVKLENGHQGYIFYGDSFQLL